MWSETGKLQPGCHSLFSYSPCTKNGLYISLYLKNTKKKKNVTEFTKPKVFLPNPLPTSDVERIPKIAVFPLSIPHRTYEVICLRKFPGARERITPKHLRRGLKAYTRPGIVTLGNVIICLILGKVC